MVELLDIAENIRDSGLKEVTIGLLKRYNKKLEELPASISGKYHLGESTKDHIIRVVWFVNRIIEEFNLNQDEKDILVSSALLHDIGSCVVTTKERKPNEQQEYYQTGWYRSIEGAQFHPIIGGILVNREAFEKGQETNLLVIKVILAISSHMSHWSCPDCPLPRDDLEKFLALADYLASRKEIQITEDGKSG